MSETPSVTEVLERTDIPSQCRATASHPLAWQMEVDGGKGLLGDLLLDAAVAIEVLSAELKRIRSPNTDPQERT